MAFTNSESITGCAGWALGLVGKVQTGIYEPENLDSSLSCIRSEELRKPQNISRLSRKGSRSKVQD